ncbi:MAG TPA: amidohydrolase family protein [Bryobacteraceae bacterium]|nr:amidohydrolase family protein [Bryobacteraceae bacterium]
MIVDVHSHYFRYPEHFSESFKEQSRRSRNGLEVDLTVRWQQYHASATSCSKTIVFGGKAKLAGLWVPDTEVAAYVAQHPDNLIGFLSLDPAQPGWREELEHGHQHLKLRGIKLMPMYGGYMPNAREFDDLWAYATKHGLPVLAHTGTTFIDKAPLECTLPRLFDDVAIRFPDVKIILAHLGHPYEGECIATIRKHKNVYADCSALHYRPFQLYHSLMLLQEYGVWSKLLFGSDYPFTTVDESLAGMRKLNRMFEGSSQSRLDMEQMERMFERDSLLLLGLT